MRVTTDQLVEIREAAQALADACEELEGVREDPESTSEDREQGSDDVDTAIRELVALLPRKVRPTDVDA